MPPNGGKLNPINDNNTTYMKISRLADGIMDFNSNYQALIHRPRVSFKISEYVWKYIYENYLFILRLMPEDKYNYSICLSFNKYNANIHKFMFDSPYNQKKCFFQPSPKFRIENGQTKWAMIGLTAECVDENINPSLYASLVYDMFCAQLIVLYKKVKKEELDNLKAGLDYEYINSFPYPASFEEQRYLTDEQVISLTHDNGKERVTQLLNMKDEYLKYWGQ